MLEWHTTATSRTSWEPWMRESFGSPLLLLEREGEGLFLLLSLLLLLLPLLLLWRDSIMFEPKQQQLFTNKRDIIISTQHICSILHLVKNKRLESKFCHERLRTLENSFVMITKQELSIRRTFHCKTRKRGYNEIERANVHPIVITTSFFWKQQEMSRHN